MRKFWVLAVILLLAVFLAGQRKLGVRPTASGGRLEPEQAAFDVQAYELDLKIDPARRWIGGSAVTEARVVEPLSSLLLDLDGRMGVSRAVDEESGRDLDYERTDDQVRIRFPASRKPGSTVRVRLHYSGQPREALAPPWVGGFLWKQTNDGRPWVGVACQVDGADLWWPSKDHPSDEPARMELRFTVPEGLVAASNGVLRGVTSESGWTTYHWSVLNPINIYNVTVNIAPYQEIRRNYRSVDGTEFPVVYYVLPENHSKGEALMDEIVRHLRFFEEALGPYPFRNEKYGVAETPYLGMEHQTMISYGHDYSRNDYGFDWLHFHELAHEWWGNLVTATDWRDYWIHEAFASYIEALYAESIQGREALHRYQEAIRHRIRNLDAVAPRESRSTVEKYFVAPEYTETDGDVNYKGSWILHTLHYLVGDERFREVLRRFAYPTAEKAQAVNGTQTRFVTTDDFQLMVEELTGQELSWFFQVYLRQPKLPELKVERSPERLHLRWEAPEGMPFPMPVEVRMGEKLRRVEVPSEGVSLPIDAEPVTVDPHNWILKAK